MSIYIIGHKNPDTDSIASAWAYAELKNKIDKGETYIPARCGNANSQTRYIFQRAGVEMPILLKDIYPKVKNIMTTKVESVFDFEPMLEVFRKIEKFGMYILPVTDSRNTFKGVVGTAELLRLFVREHVDQRPRYLFDAEYIAKAINGKIIHTGKDKNFNAALMIGAMSSETSSERMLQYGARETLLVVGNRKDLIENAVKNEIPALVITGVQDKSAIGVDFSKFNGWVYLSGLDSAETARRVILASPVSSIMTTDVPLLTPGDYIEAAQELMLAEFQRVLAVVENEKLVGILSRSDLLRRFKQKVILVDHNEADQAVDGIEAAQVLEIIDHHRLGAVKTTAPVTFYAKPVGSTCTLIYQLFMNHGVIPSKEAALLLMGGIISDTVMLKSPTTTLEDKTALEALEKISGVVAAEFGVDVFNAADSLATRSAEDIVLTDFKTYSEYGTNMGIGQAEAVTLADLGEISDTLLEELEKQRRKHNLDWAMLLVTDIIKEESVLFSTKFPAGERLLSYKKCGENKYFLPGILSRKKQLLPEILRIAEELA